MRSFETLKYSRIAPSQRTDTFYYSIGPWWDHLLRDPSITHKGAAWNKWSTVILKKNTETKSNSVGQVPSNLETKFMKQCIYIWLKKLVQDIKNNLQTTERHNKCTSHNTNRGRKCEHLEATVNHQNL